MTAVFSRDDRASRDGNGVEALAGAHRSREGRVVILPGAMTHAAFFDRPALTLPAEDVMPALNPIAPFDCHLENDQSTLTFPALGTGATIASTADRTKLG